MMQNNDSGRKQLLWTCRFLMTGNLLMILNGYFAFFQTQRQLNSPLIPRNLIFSIFSDAGNDVMIASIVSAGILLVGTWLFTFNKYKQAAWFFAAGIILPVLLILSGILQPELNT